MLDHVQKFLSIDSDAIHFSLKFIVILEVFSITRG